MEKLEVMFRRDRDGNILAIFPHEAEYKIGRVAILTKHGSSVGAYHFMIAETKPANVEDKDVKELLQDIKDTYEGVKIVVVKRQNHNKYITSYKKIRG